MVWLWLGFILFVLLLLALDLGVFHRHAHVVEVKEALLWSAVWVGLAALFGIFVYFAYENGWFGLVAPGKGSPGLTAALTYFSGYVLEKSLSVDNLFVIALIFAYFGVPPIYQHRLLVWGILGALVMRGVMILLGAMLIARFQWILYILGAFLLFTGVRMLLTSQEPEPRNNRLVRLAKRFFESRMTSSARILSCVTWADGRSRRWPWLWS
jgi:tellurite resistance protein TerC